MKSFLYLAIISIVTIPTAVFAQNYLVGIPGVDQGGGDFDAYIQAVYVMFISIAALLAVVKIIIAGLKYMFTDIVTQKGDAKKDIQGAVFGLLIVMSAVLILTVINPDLTGFTFDQDRVVAPEIDTDNSILAGYESAVLETEVKICTQIDCATEIAACTTGGYFSGEASRVGTYDTYPIGTSLSIVCYPERLPEEEALLDAATDLKVTESSCNAENLYAWNTDTSMCVVLDFVTTEVSLSDILNKDTTNERFLMAQISLTSDGEYLIEDFPQIISGEFFVDLTTVCGYLSDGDVTYTRSDGGCISSQIPVLTDELAPQNFQHS